MEYSKEADGHVLRGFKLKIKYGLNYYLVAKSKNRKGKFILATNLKDKEKFPAEAILRSYRRRNFGIENCFKILKSSPFFKGGMYFKRVDRIEAMMAVMALSLFVHNLGQYWLRKGLSSQKETILNQVGTPTKRPTITWVFDLLKKIQFVTVKINNSITRKIIGLKESAVKIINLFGPHAREIYGFP